MPRGRPTLYSPQLVKKICARISGGCSLRQVSRQNGMPAVSTLCEWLHVHKDFAEHYARACEFRGNMQGEDVNDIAEQVKRGDIPSDAGRVAIDGKKWSAARMARKQWGDKIEHTGPGGGPLQITDPARFAEALKGMSDEELAVFERAMGKALTHDG